MARAPALCVPKPGVYLPLSASPRAPFESLPTPSTSLHSGSMTHSALVDLAVQWLRTSYRCGIILSEQACCTGETPDVIGWKGHCRSGVVECKVSRADFLADRNKPWRVDPGSALGCERFYMAPTGLIAVAELPA